LNREAAAYWIPAFAGYDDLICGAAHPEKIRISLTL
jgi:hypothetical protein